VVAALREDSTTVGLDGEDALSCDRAGRLIRAFWRGRSIRRSLDNRFIEKRKAGGYAWSYIRRELEPSERRALLGGITRELSAIQEALAEPHPGQADPHLGELRARAKDILGWSAEALEADGVRFRSVYLPVPILPPDQYQALVVQLTEGCSYNQCTFCRFYRDRPFRVKSPAELRAHIRGIGEFFGEGLRLRKSVFLADANAMVLPKSRLDTAFAILREELPRGCDALRGVYSFIDAFSGVPSTSTHFGELAGQGLRRVYLGLESGCEELLRFLNKPGTAAEALELVRRLKAAGIHVGVIVMLGIGGDRYADRHLAETLATVNSMGLESRDLLYLSPLAADPDSPYRQREREAGIRPLTEADTDWQLQALKAGLRFEAGSRPKVAVYDIRDFIY
jgi:radical SAM superfamily enzyme YgiQ (UPF0313 family)